jgi:RNA polymerase sigma factor (sigma-70 family)
MTHSNEDDIQLLRRYAGGSDAAFAELTQRHVGFVYAAALRQLGGASHRAEEVTQGVFIDLARKAASLTRRTEIVGWLYTSTHHAAAKLKRDEQRRQQREQEAHTMQDIIDGPAEDTVDWNRLRPVLDSAMHELAEQDRAVILLRYFQDRRFAEVGRLLGMSEDGARMRAARALDKLHGLLARRKITSTTAALGLLLAHQPAVAVPVGLAASVTGAALAGAAGMGAGSAAGLLLFTMKAKTGLVVGLAAAGIGIGTAVFQHREAHVARATADILARERENLRRQVAGLQQSLTAEAERRIALERAAQPAPFTGTTMAPKMSLATVKASAPEMKEDPAVGKFTLMPSSGDPAEDRRRVREINGRNVDANCRALYEKLNWTAEQRETFKAMMLDCEESGSALFKKAVASARAKNPTMDRAEQFEIFEAMQAQLQREQQAETRRIFGDAAGDVLEHFQATAPVRWVARQMTNERPTNLPPLNATVLTSAQADQLVEIMANHARGPVSKVDLASLDIDAVAAQARAERLLNEEQLAALRREVSRMQAQQRAERARNTMPLAELQAKMGTKK